MTKFLLFQKNYGDKIRFKHLDINRFPELVILLKSKKDYNLAKFGILTKFYDGNVGVTIHYMRRADDGSYYGYWLHEAGNEKTIEAWANAHRKTKDFISIEAAIND